MLWLISYISSFKCQVAAEREKTFSGKLPSSTLECLSVFPVPNFFITGLTNLARGVACSEKSERSGKRGGGGVF